MREGAIAPVRFGDAASRKVTVAGCLVGVAGAERNSMDESSCIGTASLAGAASCPVVRSSSRSSVCSCARRLATLASRRRISWAEVIAAAPCAAPCAAAKTGGGGGTLRPGGTVASAGRGGEAAVDAIAG